MPTPNYSILFSAQLVASSTVSIGDVLIPSSSDGTSYVLSTTANRGTRTSEGIALTAYSGTLVSSVQMQQSGVIDASISGLPTGAVQLVRVSSAGRIERIASYTTGDDVIGYAKADGRVHLHFGLPWELIAALASAPGLPLKSLQYNNASVLAGVTEHTYEGAGRENILATGYITWGAVGSTYGSAGFLRLANIAETDYTLITHGANTVLALEPSAARAVTLGYSTGLTHLNGSTIRLSTDIVEVGTGIVATLGTMRHAKAQSAYVRNSGNTENISLWKHSTAVTAAFVDVLTLGSPGVEAGSFDSTEIYGKKGAGIAVAQDIGGVYAAGVYCFGPGGIATASTARGGFAHPNLGVGPASRLGIAAFAVDPFGGGKGILRLDRRVTAPTGNPDASLWIWCDPTTDELKSQRPDGTIVTHGSGIGLGLVLAIQDFGLT